MTPEQFLRAVWPSEGIYCLATPFTPPGETKAVFAHKTFNGLDAALQYISDKRLTNDIFFCVHTLKEHTVWDPDKINRKTGEIGATSVRCQPNMKASRAFFFDLDVGNRADKYASPEEAVRDLIRFVEVTGLPRPLVVTSGGGLHVYWIITEALESSEWRVQAYKLKQLARHHGLKCDPMRTTDTASVLRVAGTFNFKDRHNPRAVDVKTPANETGTGAFIHLVDEALIKAGVQAITPPPLAAAADALGSNLSREFEGPPVTLRALLTACKQMQRLALMARAKEEISEPEWYYGVIGVCRFIEDGQRRIMQFGDPAWHKEIGEKIKQSEKHQTGPTSCAKLADISGVGDSLCVGCPFAGKVHGPVGAARYKDPAKPPVVQELVGTVTVSFTIPDPPKPYIRMKDGSIAVHTKDADGNEVYLKIYEHDLYPVRRLTNLGAGLEQQEWHVELPRGEAKNFTLDADMVYDSRKFTAAISNHGIYPHKADIPRVQEYMVAYIAKLQKEVDADAQCSHLGWSDDFKSFILPDKIIHTDGSIKPAQLSLGAQRATMHIHRKGEARKQAELLNFYNHPAYRAHQFFILTGLGAPIFYATGQHGVIVNASGESGASKSTSLYAAASFWGQPELYPINGTNNGATIRGRNERVTVLANLPVGVDEITHMQVKDAIDLAMSITQPGHRIRLQTDGVERASIGSYKATIMLTTANNSLHGLLSTDNAAGTAGSMRVFEIRFDPTRVHTKRQADDFLHELKQNYGHLGEIFIASIMGRLDEVSSRVRAKIAEVDADLNIQSSERYWSSTIAVVLVAGEIANELGIVSYDMEAIKRWAYEVQVPHMRGVVKEEYSDPLGILSDYIESINSNIVVVAKGQAIVGAAASTYVERKPSGALFGHYEKADQMLYLLRKGFKDYCARIGANALKILDDLHEPRDGSRIVTSKNTKRTLGAGTEFAKGQSQCFAINMVHPDVSGTPALTLVTGGQQTPPSPPALSVVQ